MATYTVFGNTTPTYPLAVYNDVSTAIKVANVFYLTADNGPAIGWRCTGGRVFIPNDPNATNKPITIYAWTGDTTRPLDIVSATPDRAVVVTTPLSGGWCEVSWAPFVIDYGPHLNWVAIGYQFNDSADSLQYIACPVVSGPPPDPVDSTSAGSTLVLAESNYPGYIEWLDRGCYTLAGDPNKYPTDLWYGIDIIVDDGLATPPDPVVAYGFNEGSGVTAFDASGLNHDIAILDTSYFTRAGHHGAALMQTAANTYAISTALPWISTLNNPQLTVMFWGKRTSDGTNPDSWTVRQTDFGTSTVAWGIMMSNGTNGIMQVRMQGFEITPTQPVQPLNEWHHYCFTVNGSYIRTYIDGVMINEVGANGIVGGSEAEADNNLLVFGGDMQQQTIDDLRIFDYALKPDFVNYYMTLDVTLNNRSGQIKVWDGTSWVTHPLKVWDGTSWVTHPALGSPDGVNFVSGKN